MKFLKTALTLATVVYSLHKSSTRDVSIPDVALTWTKPCNISLMQYLIAAHTKESERLGGDNGACRRLVYVFRLTRVAKSNA